MDKASFVVVSPEDRIERLLAILGVYFDDRIVYCSFDPKACGSQLGRRTIVSPDQIDLSLIHI